MRYIPKHRRKKSRKKKLLFRLTVAVLCIAIFTVFCDMRFRPVIKRKVRDCARTETTFILDRTLLSQIEEQNIAYSDLAHIRYGSDNAITSIEIDTVAVNKFKSSLSLSIDDALRQIEQFDFHLPLGTLIGPDILSERGPNIHFSVTSSGYVQTEIKSRFEEAGINQTIHKLLLSVSVNIDCYFPGYFTSVTINTELTLAETVIVGNIPLYYSSRN